MAALAVTILDPRGLGQVVVGAELHRLDGVGHVLEARHDDDLRRLGHLSECTQHLDPLHPRHPHVQQQHVGHVFPQPVERRPAVGHARDLVPLALELAHDQVA